MGVTGLLVFLLKTSGPDELDFDALYTEERRLEHAACMASAGFVVPPDHTPITIPSFASRWFIGVAGEGYYRHRDGYLDVHFSKITVIPPRSSNPYYPDSDHFIEGVQVGLARGEPRDLVGESIPVTRWGDMLHINKTIARGEPYVFENFSTTLAVADLEMIEQYYIVLKADTTFAFDFHRATYSTENPEWVALRKRRECNDS